MNETEAAAASQSRIPLNTAPQPWKNPSSSKGSAIPERKPLLEYGDVPPDIVKTLLGNRFLCVEGGLLFIGPSGIGKSSASIQQDILWSIGEPAFGIAPARPLKIVTIQAEDDAGDLSEMVQGAYFHLELSSEQNQLSRENCAYYCHKQFTGSQFLTSVVNPILARDRPDIIRLNPLPGFPRRRRKRYRPHRLLSCATGFNPLLKNISAPPSSSTTPRKPTSALPKIGKLPIGCTLELAQPISPTGPEVSLFWTQPVRVGVFKLIAAKRGVHIGWTSGGYDERGIGRYFAWADSGSIFWNDATPEQIQAAENKDSEVSKEDLLSLVPLDEPVFKEDLVGRAKSQLKIGRDRTKSFIEALVATEKLIIQEKPRPNARAEIWLVRAKPIGPLPI